MTAVPAAPLTETVTPASGPEVGDETTPLRVAGVAGVADARSAATIMRARNWATVGSITKPISWNAVLEDGPRGAV